MEIIGKVTMIGDMVEGTSRRGKPYSAVPFVVETLEKYPNSLSFYAYNSKISELVGVQPYYTVRVHYASRVDCHNGWYLNDLRLLRVDILSKR